MGTTYDQLTTSWRAALMSGSGLDRRSAHVLRGTARSGPGATATSAKSRAVIDIAGQAGVRLEEADWFVSDGEQRVEADQRLESTTTTTTRMLSGSYQPR